MNPTPLPQPLEVRELLEGLFARPVTTTVVTTKVDPLMHPGAVVGVYTDDTLALKAIMAFDVPLAAYAGAAIALMAPAVASKAVESGLLSPQLFDNTAEILNVAASLFNADGAPHLRLYQTFAPRETLPGDAQRMMRAFVRRLDVEVEISGYGTGQASLLAI